MDESTKELLAALRQAMLAERTGYTFYLTAAQTTADPTGKEVFERLAQEEVEHHSFLSAHYRSLLDSGELSKEAKLRPHGDVEADSPIFSPALRDRIKDAHFEMSALAIAVQLELNGIQHYREQAKKATRPEVKKFFEELAVWETTHHDALTRQQQALQEEYWDEAAFQPF